MANAYCERVIGTIRREYLDYLIPLNQTGSDGMAVGSRISRNLINYDWALGEVTWSYSRDGVAALRSAVCRSLALALAPESP